MAVLRPYPFSALTRRLFRELEVKHAAFDLPARAFFPGDADLDLSVPFHGRRASSPLGPAAGPQTQMAQNIALAWLGGARLLELKTVQIRDDLDIPRPCIDMQTVGYNVEWSQELRLEESRAEYVKGMMLVEMLKASGAVPLEDGFESTLYDMSVGYDLEGIRSDRVQAFIRGMLDARDLVDRFRREIPADHRALRDLDFPSRISDTLTLSTFHGCPPDEIERIIDFLLKEHRLHCIVKLNPTLLGPTETRRLLNDALGYDEIEIPDAAFERDTRWGQMEDFVGRLAATAAGLGLGFGVKFTNTLIVRNHRRFFPESEREMYLSGQPLHVLAMNLVGRFRERFGAGIPVSFSAGIDRTNFADAVAARLVPVTVCTDLLRPGGYGRSRHYLANLTKRMREAGAATIEDFVIRAFGHGEEALRRAAGGSEAPAAAAARAALEAGGDLRAAAGEDLHARWLEEAALLNTRTYVERVTADPRYGREGTSRVPKKIGRHLDLFDCITCDKCVPVCPNDANFTIDLPKEDIPVVKIRHEDGGWTRREEEPVEVREKHQIGNFADFCNDCGNCDVFCPEDGGPYEVKPRFFGSPEAWEADGRDGFYVGRRGDGVVAHGRFAGRPYHLELPTAGPARYAGEGFRLTLDPADPERTAEGEADGEVDLTYFRILLRLQEALLSDPDTNWVNALRPD